MPENWLFVNVDKLLMTLKAKYRFIHIVETETFFGKRWEVRNNKSEAVLGEISYYDHWNDFVFQANPIAVFNDECLKDIIHFINQLKEKK